MKLGTQVGAGLALLLVLISGLAGWQLALVERLHETNRTMASADLGVSRTSLRMRLEIDRLGDLTERFFVLRDPGYRGELGRLRRLLEQDLDHLGKLPLSREELLPLLEDWREYDEQARVIEASVPSREEAPDARQTLLADLAQLRRAVAGLDARAVERVSRRIEESTARATDARRTAVLIVSTGLLLALLVAVWISRTTVRPLRSLAGAARAIAEGEFDHRVAVEGPIEVESLARDFNQMARRLGEVDRMKRNFLSSVSHDLKAPLASMQETTRLLLEDDTLNAEQRRLLELNDRCGDRLQQMIADLLDVARLEAGAVEFDLQALDLGQACHQVLAEASGLLEAGAIAIDFEASEQPLSVRADPQMLSKALWNLVSNAAKFSPEGSTIRVRLWRPAPGETLVGAAPGRAPATEDSIALAIADQGPGIPEEDKPHVFERFFRSRKHERYASGTGLGLAITQAIVEQHQGTILVGDAPGGGSLFTVLLPAEPVQTTDT